MEWGRGLVQKQALEDEQRELEELKNAPFARTADDEKLNEHQREIERWGDPMLELRERKERKRQHDDSKLDKKQKKHKDKHKPGAGTVRVRQWQCSAPWNRFSILPGYRYVA